MTELQFTRRVLKPLVFLACVSPAVYLVWALVTGNLSANPLSDVTNETGVWTLRFLCATLAISPLRRLSGWNGAIRFRRMIGLYAFFYGTLHLMTYVILDRFAGLDFSDGLSVATIVSWKTARGLAVSVAMDVYKRPFITIGSVAFLAMVPLAATSTAGMIRRLGGRRWQALHRLVYVSAIAGVVHYWWLVKADVARPQRYAIIVGVLLVLRLYWVRQRAARTSGTPKIDRGVRL